MWQDREAYVRERFREAWREFHAKDGHFALKLTGFPE